MPHAYVKVYMFQMVCALAHIHSLGVCHRDIKPQNLLVDTASHTLKLCDFGSAKILVRGERNISYICSRYYRCAPAAAGTAHAAHCLAGAQTLLRRGASDVARAAAARRSSSSAPRTTPPPSTCGAAAAWRRSC